VLLVIVNDDNDVPAAGNELNSLEEYGTSGLLLVLDVEEELVVAFHATEVLFAPP